MRDRLYCRQAWGARLLGSGVGIVFLLLSVTAPVRAALLVSSAKSNSILRFNGSTGAFVDPFVAAASGGLSYPEGLALGPDGNLYLSSANTQDVLKYDGQTGAFIGVFASGGGLDPAGLVFGPDGNLYVSSHSTGNVLRFSGQTGASMGVFASGGGLTTPTGLVFGPDGNLYVASYQGSQIVRFNGQTGAPIDVFVPVGSGGLDHPIGLAFGPDGNLYVASLNTNSVLRYNGQTGAPLGVFASGSGLLGPSGLAFGPEGNLYVASYSADSILRYSGQTGAFIDAFIPPGTAGLSGPQVGLLFTPLTAPGCLSTRVISGSQIRLSWMAGNDDETAYAIWRKTNTIDWARIGVVPPNTGTYVDGNLSANTPYTYRVRAVNNLGPSPWTNEVTATIALPAPLAPSNLAASAVSSTQVNLTWTDNSSNETAFAIWRQTGTGSWARVGVVAPNTTTFSDLGLAPNTPYTYEVRAINNGGASPWSNQATVSTPATVSFSQDILRIFSNNGAKTCAQAGCHSGGNPTGSMNLEAANAYANIVNVPSTENPALKRVKPGDSANSYLFQKVNSGQMPLTGGPLTTADINMIKTWIDQGAPNN